MKKELETVVYEFTVSKQALQAVEERERRFFMLLGFVCNEVIILQKIALSIELYNQDANDVEGKAFVTQSSFIARLIISKVFEAWQKLFQQLFFRSQFGRDYEREFSDRASEAMARLRTFFGRPGYVATLRNDYVFHYPSEKLDGALPNIPDNEDWSIYLSQNDGNSLYYLSEMIAGHAILDEIAGDKRAAYEQLIEDRTALARDIIALSTGCMNVFIDRHFGLQIGDGTEIRIKVPNLHDTELPFFSEWK